MVFFRKVNRDIEQQIKFNSLWTTCHKILSALQTQFYASLIYWIQFMSRQLEESKKKKKPVNKKRAVK